MNEKITKPTGLYFAEKNEDGSYGDPKPMPGLSDIKEICGETDVTENSIHEELMKAVEKIEEPVTVSIRIPDELWIALYEFQEAAAMYREGLCCLRKVRRYHRRFVKLHKKFIYNLGGVK